MTENQIEKLAQSIQSMIGTIGEDPQREGLQKTPQRYAKALDHLTQGYNMCPKKVLNGAIFQESYDSMILVKDIELFSLCEHHMLPFFGYAHVAYIPNGKIVGLSKIARMVDVFARRLQVQERLTTQIADTLQELLEPRGVAVIVEAKHLCMMMRGVQKQNSSTTTSAFKGEFEKEKTRGEFLRLISADLH